jgi:ABC-type multidrug transport system ATPase subunit
VGLRVEAAIEVGYRDVVGVVPADPDPQPELSVAEAVDLCGLFRHEWRLTPGEREHSRHEREVGRHAREVGKQRQRFVELVLVVVAPLGPSKSARPVYAFAPAV